MTPPDLHGQTCTKTPTGSILVTPNPIGLYLGYAFKLGFPLIVYNLSGKIWGFVRFEAWWKQLLGAGLIALLSLFCVYLIRVPLNLNFEFFADKIIRRRTSFGRTEEIEFRITPDMRFTYSVHSMRSGYQGLFFAEVDGQQPFELISFSALLRRGIDEQVGTFVEYLRSELRYTASLKKI